MSLFSGIGHFLSNAVKTAGKPFELAGKGLQSAEGAVTGIVDKIPIVGKPFSAVFSFGFDAEFGEFIAVGNILSGQRIDKAVIGQLKKQLQDIKEVAPYAEMVISFVPGIGTGVSAALAGGLALASGQPITEAIEAGVLAAIPGGAIAKAAFDVARSGVNLAISGKKVTWELLASAGLQATSDLASLPPLAKNALVGALDTAGQLAKGVKIDVAVGDGLADTASTALGKQGAAALKIGIALAHATFLQKTQAPEIQGPDLQNRLMTLGQSVIKTDPTAIAARGTVDIKSVRGFDIGVGAVRLQIDANQLVTLRAGLDMASQQGFDHAISLHIGRVANPPPPALATPAAQAGYYTTMGMQGAHPDVKAKVMANVVATSLIGKVGASVAVQQITAARRGLLSEFWQWLKSLV